jgi:hypothetical protein
MNSVFGPLEKYDERAWATMTKCELFGIEFDIEVIIGGNDSSATINEEQFLAMDYFQNNKKALLASAEQQIREHALAVRDAFVPTMVELTGLVFPMVINPGECVFGLLLECEWDEENGLAVKFDGTSLQTGSQDLLT